MTNEDGVTPQAITALLRKWQRGDAAALDDLLTAVLPELRRLAQANMRRERKEHTLQPTAVVNEAFIRLVRRPALSWMDRSHFFAVCARLMRQVLVDHARGRLRLKRGAGATRVLIDEETLPEESADMDVLALHEALTRLARIDRREHDIVELRFFGGLTIEETAAFLGVSATTVKEDWRVARAWLYQELQSHRTSERPSP